MKDDEQRQSYDFFEDGLEELILQAFFCVVQQGTIERRSENRNWDWRSLMIADDELNAYRVDGTRIRVERDSLPQNDVTGVVVAWDEEMVLVRKPNKRLLKLSRSYRYRPATEPRSEL